MRQLRNQRVITSRFSMSSVDSLAAFPQAYLQVGFIRKSIVLATCQQWDVGRSHKLFFCHLHSKMPPITSKVDWVKFCESPSIGKGPCFVEYVTKITLPLEVMIYEKMCALYVVCPLSTKQWYTDSSHVNTEHSPG